MSSLGKHLAEILLEDGFINEYSEKIINQLIAKFKQENSSSSLVQQKIMLLEQAAKSEVVWDEIIHIEYYDGGEDEYVYDFTVHVFGKDFVLRVSGIIWLGKQEAIARRVIAMVNEPIKLTENRRGMAG